MNAHESENYLAISRSSSASKSVEIFWAEIYWVTNMAAHTDGLKNNLTHCKHVPCNTLTHSTNEDLLNIKSAKVILSLVPSLARPIPLKPGTRV
jgi:hypothetical protein